MICPRPRTPRNGRPTSRYVQLVRGHRARARPCRGAAGRCTGEGLVEVNRGATSDFAIDGDQLE